MGFFFFLCVFFLVFLVVQMFLRVFGEVYNGFDSVCWWFLMVFEGFAGCDSGFQVIGGICCFSGGFR